MALLGQVYSGEQLDYLPAMMGGAETVVINDLDWQVCERSFHGITCLSVNVERIVG